MNPALQRTQKQRTVNVRCSGGPTQLSALVVVLSPTPSLPPPSLHLYPCPDNRTPGGNDVAAVVSHGIFDSAPAAVHAGTTASQAKIPQEVRAATDSKPAAAVCTTAAPASAADSTANSAPHDEVNNTATTAKSAAFAAGAAGTSAASSTPSWAHQSAAAVRPSTESVTFSMAADGRVKPLAAVHPAVAPTTALPLPAAPAPTQATAPLRQDDSSAPSDGRADRAAPIYSIPGAEMLRIFLIRDAPSLADAATALGAERGVQGTGLLRKALRSTGPVAVRLDGRDLGAEDGVIQTVQVSWRDEGIV